MELAYDRVRLLAVVPELSFLWVVIPGIQCFYKLFIKNTYLFVSLSLRQSDIKATVFTFRGWGMWGDISEQFQ